MRKKWTILIYANGNNEYEPEMYNTFKDLEEIPIIPEINIIIQLARENPTIARLIRQDLNIPERESWVGVRRYEVFKGKSRLLKNLGQINMADPKNLLRFLNWGIENYPAQKYIVILGGHSISLIGGLPDFSQERPYVMGLPELCQVFNLLKKRIDLVIFDMCYMNYIEIMYELGKKKNSPVKNVLTYIGEGPMAGLSYNQLINLLKHEIDIDSKDLLNKLINLYQEDLIGIEVQHSKLIQIKRNYNQLAQCFLKKDRTNLSLEEMLRGDYCHGTCLENLKILNKSIEKIIVNYRCNNSKKNLLEVAMRTLEENLLNLYLKWSFAFNNHWLKLLNSNNVNIKRHISLKPLPLHKNGVRLLIKAMNPTNNEEQNTSILNKIVVYKNWNL